MVSFQCHACGDVVKKPKLDQHRNRCGSGYDCIDCSKTFNTPAEYRTHTTCISEAEKYQKGLYKGPKINHGNGLPPQSRQQWNRNGARNGYNSYNSYARPRSMASGANDTPLGTPKRMSPVENQSLPGHDALQTTTIQLQPDQNGKEKRQAEPISGEEPPTKKAKIENPSTDKEAKREKKKEKKSKEHSQQDQTAVTTPKATKNETVDEPSEETDKEAKRKRKAEKKALREAAKADSGNPSEKSTGAETPEEAKARRKAAKKAMKNAAKQKETETTQSNDTQAAKVTGAETGVSNDVTGDEDAKTKKEKKEKKRKAAEIAAYSEAIDNKSPEKKKKKRDKERNVV